MKNKDYIIILLISLIFSLWIYRHQVKQSQSITQIKESFINHKNLILVKSLTISKPQIINSIKTIKNEDPTSEEIKKDIAISVLRRLSELKVEVSDEQIIAKVKFCKVPAYSCEFCGEDDLDCSKTSTQNEVDFAKAYYNWIFVEHEQLANFKTIHLKSVVAMDQYFDDYREYSKQNQVMCIAQVEYCSGSEVLSDLNNDEQELVINEYRKSKSVRDSLDAVPIEEQWEAASPLYDSNISEEERSIIRASAIVLD